MVCMHSVYHEHHEGEKGQEKQQTAWESEQSSGSMLPTSGARGADYIICLHPHDSSYCYVVPTVLLSVQFSSVAQSCLTLCNSMDCSMPWFPCPSPTPHAHSLFLLRLMMLFLSNLDHCRFDTGSQAVLSSDGVKCYCSPISESLFWREDIPELEIRDFSDNWLLRVLHTTVPTTPIGNLVSGGRSRI